MLAFTTLLALAAPLMVLAGPVDHTAEPANALRETRAVPGCVVRHKFGGESTEAGLARYRTIFTAEKIPSSDICKVPYFNCMAMSNRQCWTRADGTTLVDGNFAKGAAGAMYKSCLNNAMRQWASDNKCKCEGDQC